MIRHAVRHADGAEKNRVVLSDPLLPVLRHHAAVLFVIIAAGEIEIVKAHFEAELFRHRLKHAHTFRHDFLADAVAWNDGNTVDAVGFHGGVQAKYCPPLAVSVEPVIRPASSEARNTT